ncbi:MAG: hypothetical protein IPK18_01320 [Sphingobacteriales bacterium]|nr:MAG: hypothetical protein IPK18_01320 [Sphingobacteriales bacterium]
MSKFFAFPSVLFVCIIILKAYGFSAPNFTKSKIESYISTLEKKNYIFDKNAEPKENTFYYDEIEFERTQFFTNSIHTPKIEINNLVVDVFSYHPIWKNKNCHKVPLYVLYRQIKAYPIV